MYVFKHDVLLTISVVLGVGDKLFICNKITWHGTDNQSIERAISSPSLYSGRLTF